MWRAPAAIPGRRSSISLVVVQRFPSGGLHAVADTCVIDPRVGRFELANACAKILLPCDGVLVAFAGHVDTADRVLRSIDIVPEGASGTLAVTLQAAVARDPDGHNVEFVVAMADGSSVELIDVGGVHTRPVAILGDLAAKRAYQGYRTGVSATSRPGEPAMRANRRPREGTPDLKEAMVNFQCLKAVVDSAEVQSVGGPIVAVSTRLGSSRLAYWRWCTTYGDRDMYVGPRGAAEAPPASRSGAVSSGEYQATYNSVLLPSGAILPTVFFPLGSLGLVFGTDGRGVGRARVIRASSEEAFLAAI
jgi:hypothetical protein